MSGRPIGRYNAEPVERLSEIIDGDGPGRLTYWANWGDWWDIRLDSKAALDS